MTADLIVRVASVFDVTIHDLTSASRARHIVYARQALMLLLRQHGYLSLAAIGQKLDRDHSTVLHGINAAIMRMATDARYAALVCAARGEAVDGDE